MDASRSVQEQAIVSPDFAFLGATTVFTVTVRPSVRFDCVIASLALWLSLLWVIAILSVLASGVFYPKYWSGHTSKLFSHLVSFEKKNCTVKSN